MTADIFDMVPEDVRHEIAVDAAEVLEHSETPWADDEDGYDREDQR